MKITAKLLTLGADPEAKFTENGLMATFPLAENINRNVGTQDNPEWQRVKTCWYSFAAFGETAEKVLDELSEGDAIELVAGKHDTRNIGTKEEPNIKHNYTLYEYKKYPSRRK